MSPKIPYCEAEGSLSVKVVLKNASNVFLVDKNNFRRYQNGQRFKYYGGYYERNPVNIKVNGTGTFYLVVTNSDYSYEWY
ncbi:DUF1883 domain-containing protein [Mammaliicoccus sciuri]|uniref:DUF1883 domain-containing protein n=1 Tax=Mammaliicoccus sciuri TaxID=1296 RepID=UPI001FB33F4F|nr:DUF1883 domain-containing protein [Mammaliicoccus sciuri]MCJ1776324.1 DUF1883 domain-containing protein [Mammaliicoccus sciuri]